MTIHDKVEHLLKNKPALRDSDKKLLISVWAIEGLGLSDTQIQRFMEKCSTAESITRARRHLSEKYPPSKEVDEARHEKYNEYTNNKAVSWM